MTANVISPAVTLTPDVERYVQNVADRKQWGGEWSSIERCFAAEMMPNPVGRIGRVEDVADLVTFLASPRADYMNGANLRADGGAVPTTN